MEQNVDQLIAEAEALAKSGDLENAENKYLEALKADPKSASAHYGLGTIALQTSQPEHALNCLRNAQSIEPEAFDIAYNLAHCCFQLGDHRQAVLQLQHATKYCKADPVFCPLIADFLLRLGEPEAAIQLLSRLQVLRPEDQIILARAQAAKANWRESVEILRRLNSVLPNDAKVSNDLAVAAGKLRDYTTAISSFERYLTLITPTANDYLRFADLLLIAQQADRCSKAIMLAKEKGEDSAEVFVLEAKVARLNRDYSIANIALDQALERVPNDGQAWTLRAELVAPELLDEAIESLREQLNKADDLALQHKGLLNYAMAEMCDRKGDFERAADALLTANNAQHRALENSGQTYQPEVTTQMVDRLIGQFDASFFSAGSSEIGANGSNATIAAQNATEAGNREVQPIFIVGMPRSGTTLVERIIGQNSNIYNGGEQEAMEYMAAELNQKIRSGKLPSISEISDRQWLDLRDIYFEKLPAVSKPIITDKLPHNFRHVGIIHKLFPEARVIQMHRDQRDVCMSIYSKAFSTGHNYANRWSDLSHFYSECERLMAHWSSMNSPQILNLNYEDLVRDPEHYGQQLIEFCGFKWDVSYLEFHQAKSKSFTFSEMQVRQPIADKRIGRWQNYSNYFPELQDLCTSDDTAGTE